MSTVANRPRRRAQRYGARLRPRRIARRGPGRPRVRRSSIPVWGLALALGTAVVVFMLVLANVADPLAGLRPLIEDAGALLQPRAPVTTSDERLVPRREDPAADVAEVPSVVNLDRDDARQVLEDAGFRPQVEEVFDDAVAEGLVISQEPPAGEALGRLEPVVVTVSRGPSLASLPNVVGLAAEDARADLDRRGFQVIEVTAFNEDVPAGTVLGQEPLAGAVVDRRSVVVLRISRGVEIAPVPPVVGRGGRRRSPRHRAGGSCRRGDDIRRGRFGPQRSSCGSDSGQRGRRTKRVRRAADSGTDWRGGRSHVGRPNGGRGAAHAVRQRPSWSDRFDSSQLPARAAKSWLARSRAPGPRWPGATAYA